MNRECIESNRSIYIEDTNLIQLIYPSDADLAKEDPLNKILLVSDTDNHCIRAVDLKGNKTLTIAGKCGEPGFKDGFLRTSRMNKPTHLGIDIMNRVLIYDSENNYIRLLELKSEFVEFDDFVMSAKLKTLIHGACVNIEDDYKDNSIYEMNFAEFNYSFCYIDWITGKESSNYYDFDAIDQYCTLHYAECLRLN